MEHNQISTTKNSNISHIMYSENLNKCLLSYMHLHEPIEVLYLTRGSIKCTLADSEIIIRPEDILFINSNIPHATDCLEDGTDCALFQFRNPAGVNIRLTYLTEFLNISDVATHLFDKSDPDYEEIHSCLQRMLERQADKSAEYNYYTSADIYILMAILHRRKFLIDDQSIVDIELLNKIIPVFQYIDENYADHLTLDDLAKSVNFHKEYFCRLFKQATGNTVVDYLNFVRVYKAEELLRQNISATEVSYMVGFSSPSYFTKVFKKYRLCSPSMYKKIYENPDTLMFQDKNLFEDTDGSDKKYS